MFKVKGYQVFCPFLLHVEYLLGVKKSWNSWSYSFPNFFTQCDLWTQLVFPWSLQVDLQHTRCQCTVDNNIKGLSLEILWTYSPPLHPPTVVILFHVWNVLFRVEWAPWIAKDHFGFNFVHDSQFPSRSKDKVFDFKVLVNLSGNGVELVKRMQSIGDMDSMPSTFHQISRVYVLWTNLTKFVIKKWDLQLWWIFQTLTHKSIIQVEKCQTLLLP